MKTYIGKLLVLSLTFSFFSPRLHAADLSADQVSQVTDLLDSFSSGCSLMGTQSEEAVVTVKRLVQSLQGVNDPKCSGVAGVMFTYTQALSRAESWAPWKHSDYNDSTDIEVNRLQSQKQEISFLLSHATDPSEIQILKDEMRQTQVSLIGSLSEQKDNTYNDRRIREARAMQELVTASSIAMDQIASNQQCWSNKPSLLREIGSAAVGVGAVASTATPASESAVMMGAGFVLIAKVMDFYDRMSKASKLNKFTLSLAPAALTCALERMNNVMCSAIDTRRAIEIVGSKVHGTDPIWMGVAAIEHDLPNLIAWLERLKTGGSPANTEDGEKLAHFAINETKLAESKTIVRGYIKDQEKIYKELTDPYLKFQQLKSMATYVANSFCVDYSGMQGGTTYVNNHPLCKVMNESDVPFYLLGITRIDRDLLKRNAGIEVSFSSMSLDQINAAGVRFNFDVGNIESQFLAWHASATQRFFVEKRLALGGNLKLVFSEAVSSTAGFDKSRNYPAGALKNLIEFLSFDPALNSSNGALSSGQQQFKLETIEALQLVLDQINGVNTGAIKVPEDAKIAIETKLNLSRGTSEIRDAVVHLVNSQVNWLVLDSKNVPEDVVVQWLAAKDFLTELRKYHSDTVTNSELDKQAELSIRLMYQNILNFYNLFQDPLSSAINSYDGNAGGMNFGGSNSRLKAELCFMNLMTPKWNQYFSLEPCIGIQEKSVDSRGPATPIFSKALFSKPYTERACAYRNFVRREQILERKRM